ncbi:MAG: photoactive yellow protein [Candidatus Sericytochromatia bacterium]|nr:photoactive yellow protein [Candidatus Sericytochromatia bacterium]
MIPVRPEAERFVPDAVLQQLDNLSRTEADSLPFGAIRVDDAGIIQLYNRFESELVGITTAQAEGLNFFTRIAPCTNNRLFFGRFKEGLAANALDIVFPYTFTYKMRATNVLAHLYRTQSATPTNWLFIERR